MNAQTTVATDQVESRCRGCHAPVRFRATPAGKQIPLDHAPLTDYVVGAYVVVDDQRCRPAEPLMDVGRPMFLTHFASCPNASDFRPRKRGR